MTERNRASLKNNFLKGTVPKEKDFHDLIDSSVNKLDDGLRKEPGSSIGITAESSNSEILRFFKNIEDIEPKWNISLRSSDGKEGLNIKNSEGESNLFIEQQGNIGIGTESPRNKLHVDGFIGMTGRIGYYAYGEVAADGNWHEIISNLNHYNAFEIIMVTGRKGAHAITHAIAVSAYGNSRPKVTKTQGFFGRSRNKIDVKWSGNYFDYGLQIRTRRNLGEGVFINFYVTKLI
jgi:hypothetical protein